MIVLNIPIFPITPVNATNSDIEQYDEILTNYSEICFIFYPVVLSIKGNESGSKPSE
jgi:hypothetical protein